MSQWVIGLQKKESSTYFYQRNERVCSSVTVATPSDTWWLDWHYYSQICRDRNTSSSSIQLSATGRLPGYHVYVLWVQNPPLPLSTPFRTGLTHTCCQGQTGSLKVWPDGARWEYVGLFSKRMIQILGMWLVEIAISTNHTRKLWISCCMNISPIS